MHSSIIWHQHTISKHEHSRQKNQKPCLLWLSGLSGSGKSTIANALEKALYHKGKHTYLLDGDNIRHGLNKDLGFCEKDRSDNIRRIGEVSRLFVDAGLIVITAFISPFQKDRESVKNLFEENEYIEIFIDAPLDVCEQRDTKGLYEKARKGEITDFTGIDSPYERPLSPAIHIETQKQSIDESVEKIIVFLDANGYFKSYD